MPRKVQEVLADQGLVQTDHKARWVAAIMGLVGLVAPWIFQGEVPDPTSLQDWFTAFISMGLNGGFGWAITYFKSNFVAVLPFLILAVACASPVTVEQRQAIGQGLLAAIQYANANGIDPVTLAPETRERIAATCENESARLGVAVAGLPGALGAYCPAVLEAAEAPPDPL